MALQTPVITVSNVTVPLKNLYTITFLMTVADDDIDYDGITTTSFINVRPGDNVDDKVAPVIADFQTKIDDYQAGVGIQESPAMTTAIAAIGSGVSV